MIRHALALVLTLLALVASGCAESPQESTQPAASAESAAAESAAESEPAAPAAAQPEPCNLVVGWDPWEPYQFMDVDGNVRGLDIELVEAAFGAAGCAPEYVEGRWATLLRQLQEGRVDVLTGATRTPSRESFAHFTQPYRDEDFKLYVRIDEIEKYSDQSLEELLAGGFKVGVTNQYVYGDTITNLQEDPRYADQFMGATVGELNFARVLDLGIDGFIEDPFVAAWTLRNKGMADDIGAHPMLIHSGEVTLMFSRESVEPDVVARIDAALGNLKASGEHAEIVGKYLRIARP